MLWEMSSKAWETHISRFQMTEVSEEDVERQHGDFLKLRDND